jgi:hypothetical protein
MLRARVCDPAGPGWWRTAATIGLLPLAVLALVLPLPAGPRVATMLAGLAWLVLGRIVVPRLRTAECTVDVGPTEIALHGAGAASQRIEARHVRAASTASLSRGYSLGLVRHGEGDPPLWLELGSQADLDRIRRALGIGHAGFGVLAWPPRRGVFHVQASTLDFLAALGWLATIGLVLTGSVERAITVAILFVPVTLIALALAVAGRTPAAALSLSRRGLRVTAGGDNAETPWTEVVGATATSHGVLVSTTAGAQAVPMPAAGVLEREHMAAQIRSAMLRARGEGPPAPGIPASVAVLAPRDEAPRAWLERVDATAASMARGEGYRHAAVEAADLWTALESTDAPSPVRAAAARILARVAPEQAGPRIAQVLAQEHDAVARDRIRVALEDDVEVAAREMESLDRA